MCDSRVCEMTMMMITAIISDSWWLSRPGVGLCWIGRGGAPKNIRIVACSSAAVIKIRIECWHRHFSVIVQCNGNNADLIERISIGVCDCVLGRGLFGKAAKRNLLLKRLWAQEREREAIQTVGCMWAAVGIRDLGFSYLESRTQFNATAAARTGVTHK